jgi:tryptophanyl-tRNA synthetase
MAKPVILTGLRANSEFHLGNYLGAILPMVELQKQFAGSHQLNMFVPDLHSFTTPIEHGSLFDQIIKNLHVYVASGLDLQSDDTFIYRQSFVPAHSELAIILNNFTYYGELHRMTQFKEKAEADKHGSVSAGLFDYPVLMTADILLYGAEWIPVGEDQRQHIELARDLALRMNHMFGEDLFVVPAAWKKQLHFAHRDTGVRIRSLRNPEKKMSKSVADPAGTIRLSDTQPGISNLLQISALLANQPIEATVQQWQGSTSYGDLKSAVAAQVRSFLIEFQDRLATVDSATLMHKLEASELMMREVAGQRLYQVQKSVGLRP